MSRNKIVRHIILYVITAIILVNVFPVKHTEASSKKYLIIIKQQDGSYQYYEDMAVEKNNNIMIKVKPFAKAANMSYKNGNGNGKGCIISNHFGKLIFTRNSRNYVLKSDEYSIDYISNYKQCIIDSYNTVHWYTLFSLMRCRYFSAERAPEFKAQGYSGVIVYNNYDRDITLPGAVKNDSPDITPEIHDLMRIDQTNKTQCITAYYQAKNGPKQVELDLTKVLLTYQKYGLPNDGVYGFGNCNNNIEIKGIDKDGKSVGIIKTDGKEFLIDFPQAVRLKITGDIKNLIISFFPVKPIILTKSEVLSVNDIDWISHDGYSWQYFILPEYTLFNMFNWNYQVPIHLEYKILEVGNSDSFNFTGAFKSLTLYLENSLEELKDKEDDIFFEFKIMDKVIDLPKVIVYDGNNNSMSSNYETELIKMMDALKEVGLNTYFPKDNWISQLKVMVKDGIETGGASNISIRPEDTDMNNSYDYIVHLHEMTHFYEAQKAHYGFLIKAWVEGNAIALSEKALEYLEIDDDGYYENDFRLDVLEGVDKQDFEKYYLEVDGHEAYAIGYHFNKYLRDYYGEDIIFRIHKAIYDDDTTTSYYKNSESDKGFIDCIKSVTSQTVFQDFAEQYLK
ncbi:hypothetical protein I5677_10765 [Mobilitalea sibirica]|uniref:Uncharacterized protein n=1 Tax=Mobilitalea sibirica TaxID=1462919 RepID=A0A8J7HDZ1_9FIRM|nr:hypothetical protein [Mobilitalea sibirica]MBH1941374.1 hypothetical protein [Mobilitalea sibirica]